MKEFLATEVLGMPVASLLFFILWSAVIGRISEGNTKNKLIESFKFLLFTCSIFLIILHVPYAIHVTYFVILIMIIRLAFVARRINKKVNKALEESKKR